MAELSTKPYLIRAIHEWCADCGHTPYLAVAVDDRTVVPRAYVKNGEIVLNVSMSATNRLTIGNELIEFQARFGGAPHELSIPVENVTAIYARETGHGMAFDVPKPPAVKEERRPPKPTAVASVPRPAPSETPRAPIPDPAPTESDVPLLPIAAPVAADPAPDTAAPAVTPVPTDSASGSDHAVETDVAMPVDGPAPSAQDPVAPADPAPGFSVPTGEVPGSEGDGGGKPRRGGRPKLTRVK